MIIETGFIQNIIEAVGVKEIGSHIVIAISLVFAMLKLCKILKKAIYDTSNQARKIEEKHYDNLQKQVQILKDNLQKQIQILKDDLKNEITVSREKMVKIQCNIQTNHVAIDSLKEYNKDHKQELKELHAKFDEIQKRNEGNFAQLQQKIGSIIKH